MLSKMLYACMELMAYVKFTIFTKETKVMKVLPWLLCPVRVFSLREQESESEGDATAWKKQCSYAVSHRAWTGRLAGEPLHVCLWQLTLSLRQQTFNTTTLPPQLCNTDYIITHHTHLTGCFDIVCVKGATWALQSHFKCGPKFISLAKLWP